VGFSSRAEDYAETTLRGSIVMLLRIKAAKATLVIGSIKQWIV